MIGLRILFEMPHPVTIRECAVPFLHLLPEDVDLSLGEYDLYIYYKDVSSLPARHGDEIKIGDRYYCKHKEWDIEHFCVWHCATPTSEPYAFVHWINASRIEVLFLPERTDLVNLGRQLFNLIGMETLLLANNGFMLHSSFISYRNKGILFSASSGTGKSTQADLWIKYCGAEIINGDRAGLIRENTGSWLAYGLPYAGSSGIYKNKSVRICMVVMLSQSQENTVHRMSRREAFQQIYTQVVAHRWDTGFVNETMNRIVAFISEVPVYHLACRPDKEATDLIREIADRLIDMKHEEYY